MYCGNCTNRKWNYECVSLFFFILFHSILFHFILFFFILIIHWYPRNLMDTQIRIQIHSSVYWAAPQLKILYNVIPHGYKNVQIPMEISRRKLLLFLTGFDHKNSISNKICHSNGPFKMLWSFICNNNLHITPGSGKGL